MVELKEGESDSQSIAMVTDLRSFMGEYGESGKDWVAAYLCYNETNGESDGRPRGEEAGQ